MRRSHFFCAIIIIASISFFVVLSRNSHAAIRCSLDGSRIEPMYEVIINQKDKPPGKFASITSARIWLKGNSAQAISIQVTDEVTGEKINAAFAFYVESDVITTPHTGNRIHVFAQEETAISHARKHNGKLIKYPFKPIKNEADRFFADGSGSTSSPIFISVSAQKLFPPPEKFILIHEQIFCFMFLDYSAGLTNGYSIPPYKPPQKNRIN
jgi:hypothetical protein